MQNTLQDVLVLDVRRFDAALGNSGIRTVSELARRVGLSRARVSTIRSGLIPPLEWRKRIAKELGADYALLWPIAGQLRKAQ